MSRSKGFTLVELMVVILIVGILAAMGIAYYNAMVIRAKDASTVNNMHAFQLAAEEYATRNDGSYATDAATVAAGLPGVPVGSTFMNPFDKSTGSGNSWRDQATWSAPLASGTTKPGCVAYGDSLSTQYQIVGRGGRNVDVPLILCSGGS